MPHIQGIIHGVASMLLLIIGSVMTDTILNKYEVFVEFSSAVSHLLLDTLGVPVSEEIAGVVLPVGILMFIWVFIYELRRISTE